MRDRPIIFSAPMVRALLAGAKTQTRRVLKAGIRLADDLASETMEDLELRGWGTYRDAAGRAVIAKPPFAVGDRLWVRESYWIATKYSYGTTPGGGEVDPPALEHRSGDPVFYAADGAPPNCHNRHYGPQGLRNGAYAAPDPYAVWQRYPSIHMPRWAARITLAVTDVRVERLQAISGADTIAEGVECTTCAAMAKSACGKMGCPASRLIFSELWNSINGPGAWEANPWVVALTFTVEPDRVR